MMLFSKRLELANRATEWLGNKNLSPVNIVTALDALGALSNSPSEAKGALREPIKASAMYQMAVAWGSTHRFSEKEMENILEGLIVELIKVST